MKLTLTIQARFESVLPFSESSFPGVKIQLNGECVPFAVFEEKILRQLFGQYEQTGPLFSRARANHFAEFKVAVEYRVGQLIIGDIDIANLVLNGRFFVYFQPMRLVSRFELKGMGRTCSLAHEGDIHSRGNLQLELFIRL